jgi:dTDP-4-amino-4,6-dideoxygalactose transaminase
MSGPNWPAWPVMDSDTIQRVSGVLLGGRLAVSGARSRWPSRNLAAAEAIARLSGRQHAVLTTSGSSAIVIALQAAGVGPGDVVLMPATTWVSCATSVLRVGARPAFFDADPGSPCLIGTAPDVLPKAVLGIHLYGQLFDVDAIRRAYPAAILIEDASHSQMGVSPDGRMVGTLGDISIMSLQATKILTSGEGGVVLCDDPGQAARIESLVMDSRRRAAVVRQSAANELEPAFLLHGANHAMSEAAAALLLDQMDRMPAQAALRAERAGYFIDRMADTGWQVYADASAVKSGNFYGLVIGLPQDRSDRDGLVQEVYAGCGLTLDTVYPAVPDGPLFRPQSVRQYQGISHISGSLDNSRRWHERSVVVPHHAFLASTEELNALADLLSTGRRTSARPTAVLPTIDVILITRGERQTITEAVASVKAQIVPADVRLTIWIDRSEEVPEQPWLSEAVRGVRVMRVGGSLLPEEPFARIAALRTMALTRVDADYCAFVDDDNSWAADHLRSLLELAGEGHPAVHSWRSLTDHDGHPATVDTFPWLPPGPAAEARFAELVEIGVMAPGEPTVRDGVERGQVDMGEWLFETQLLRQLFFEGPRTPREVEERLGEDDLLLRQLRRLGVPVACTEQASLRYRLGGMSNPESA